MYGIRGAGTSEENSSEVSTKFTGFIFPRMNENEERFVRGAESGGVC